VLWLRPGASSLSFFPDVCVVAAVDWQVARSLKAEYLSSTAKGTGMAAAALDFGETGRGKEVLRRDLLG
jgi:hypothetical protein